MEDQEIYEKVYFRILNYISFKPRTNYEIQNKISRCFPKRTTSSQKEKIKEKIVGELQLDGYINDERYVKDYVLSLERSPKTKSSLAIKAFLQKKGVDPELIEKIWTQLPENFELESAKKDAIKRKNAYKEQNTFILKAKLTKYLLSKGYSYEIVYNAVDTVLGVK